ncbi:MAG: hypothetical protein RJA20_563 [Bacteroidota bacterium]
MTDLQTNEQILKITEQTLKNWRETSRWALFFAVLFFLFTGITGLFTLMFLLDPSMGSATLTGIIFISLLFLPGYWLLRFYKGMKKALKNNETAGLESAFSNLKWFYVYSGIMTILYFSLVFIAMITS